MFVFALRLLHVVITVSCACVKLLWLKLILSCSMDQCPEMIDRLKSFIARGPEMLVVVFWHRKPSLKEPNTALLSSTDCCSLL